MSASIYIGSAGYANPAVTKNRRPSQSQTRAIPRSPSSPVAEDSSSSSTTPPIPIPSARQSARHDDDDEHESLASFYMNYSSFPPPSSSSTSSNFGDSIQSPRADSIFSAHSPTSSLFTTPSFASLPRAGLAPFSLPKPQPDFQKDDPCPEIETLIPHHKMNHEDEGFTVKSSDGRVFGFGVQKKSNIWHKKFKNEDFIRPILVKGIPSILPVSFFQDMINEAHQEAVALNKQDARKNGGGACIAVAQMTKDKAIFGNLGDTPAGIINVPEKPEEQAPTASEFSQRHALGYSVGNSHFEKFYKLLKFTKGKGYIWNLLKTRGLQITKSLGDSGRCDGILDENVRKQVHDFATELYMSDTQDLKKGDHIYLHSDGLEVNPNYTKTSSFGITDNHLKEIFSSDKPLSAQEKATCLSGIINKLNEYRDRDDQIFVSIDPSQIKQNESVFVLVGDGHGGSDKIAKATVDIFRKKLKEHLDKFPPQDVQSSQISLD